MAELGPIMIVGASGSVGGYLSRRWNPGSEVVGTFLSTPAPGAIRLDAADPSAVRSLIADVAPQAVVICAALANPDTCQSQPTASHRANVEVPTTLARVCADTGARLIHLSTDYVFDGEQGPYAEDASTHPVNVYGRDKLLGEQAVLASDPHAVVLRTSVVYGGGKPGAVDQVRHFLSQGLPLSLSPDHFNTPTDVADLAWLLAEVLRSDVGGVYHAAGPRTMSRFEFGVEVARVFGLQDSLIQPLTAAAAQAAGRAPRPRRCGLLIERASADFGFRPRDLREGVGRRYAGQ